jgi:hypothetical protein
MNIKESRRFATDHDGRMKHALVATGYGGMSVHRSKEGQPAWEASCAN